MSEIHSKMLQKKKKENYLNGRSHLMGSLWGRDKLDKTTN
jgi:hypothetical protein